MTQTLTILVPESIHNPDVQWRMEEYVRVLNASKIIEDATASNGGFRMGWAFTRDDVFSLDKPGKKFTRIVRDNGTQRFVHCFVENATGKIIKSAGWASPAKDKDGLAVRYDLMDQESRTLLYIRGTRASFYKE